MSDTDATQDTEPTTVDEPVQDDKDWKAETDKWKALARKHEGQAKANAEAARKLAELEEAGKSEVEKASERAATAEQRAAEAEAKALRYEVAAETQLPANLLRFLHGNSREELQEQAEALLAAVQPDTGDTTSDDQPRRAPKERLRPGAVPAADPDPVDPRAAHQQLVAGLLGTTT